MQWEERSIKKIVRQGLLDQLWFDRPISYLGLPAGRAIFEEDLLKKIQISKAMLFERNATIMTELKAHCSNSEAFATVDYQCIQEDVDDWLDLEVKAEEKFIPDFAWLDYCGPITTKRLDHLQNLAKEMPLDGILAVTFMVGREKTDARVLLELTSGDSVNEIEGISSACLSRVRIVINAMKFTGLHFNVSVQSYADKVPMLLLVFKKAKKSNTDYLSLTRTVVDMKEYLKSGFEK